MRTPEEISWYPLDVKKDEDSEGLWFYVPAWVVRGFKLKYYGSNFGKIKFVIRKRWRSILEYSGEEHCADEYWKRNWCKKIARENKKRRLENQVSKNE